MTNEESEIASRNNDGVLKTVINDASNFLTGIPDPIKKSFFKAVGQLCTAAVDVPVSYLEGKAAENRAETEARIAILKTNEKQIVAQMNVSKDYAQIAVEKFGKKILREQVNLDSIVKIASEELKSAEYQKEEQQGKEETECISDDWLNAFEKEACQKSSDEMKLLFGKILAGEICNPSSFSIRTLRLISQLDNTAANLFQRLCSLAVSQRIGSYFNDARVLSFSGSPSQNSLQKYGLSFSSLNILEEYGLIISDYNSYMTYDNAIAQTKLVPIPLIYNNKKFGLVWEGEDPIPNNQPLKLNGVAFSKAGKELLSIVDITPDKNYTSELVQFFKNKKFQFVEIIHNKVAARVASRP